MLAIVNARKNAVKKNGGLIVSSAISAVMSETEVRRSLMSAALRSPLPSAYQEVEYLESTSVQYLDTGYLWDDTDSIEMRILFNENKTQAFFGFRKTVSASAVGEMRFLFRYNSETLAVRWGATNFLSASLPRNTEHIILMKNGGIYVNGITVSASVPKFTPINPLSAYLFGINATGYYSADVAFVSAKIYSFLVKNSDGEEKNHLIPCYRKSDNKPGMYDIVSDRFLTNLGSGEDFILGPDVI